MGEGWGAISFGSPEKRQVRIARLRLQRAPMGDDRFEVLNIA